MRSKQTDHPLIAELWVREAWYTRTGLTLETAWALYTPREFAQALKYWEIEAKITQSSTSQSAQGADATEAAYQALKAQAQKEAPSGFYPDGDHGPADAGGH